jgi:hypothetical protein
MATGALNAQGVWIYGEDDSETTFSALLNKLGTSVSNNMKGRIAQVVHGFTSTGVSSATGTYINTGLSATITPTSATSRIIVLVEQNGIFRNGTAHTFLGLRLMRDSTQLRQVDTYAATTLTPVLAEIGVGGIGINHVETSGSTTARTYRTMFASANGQPTVNVQFANAATSTITLIEVTA